MAACFLVELVLNTGDPAGVPAREVHSFKAFIVMAESCDARELSPPPLPFSLHTRARTSPAGPRSILSSSRAPSGTYGPSVSASMGSRVRSATGLGLLG